MKDVPGTNQLNAYQRCRDFYFGSEKPSKEQISLFSAGFKYGVNFGKRSTLTKLGYREYREMIQRDAIKKKEE